ncbi:AraC family transcriptional regulator [Lentilactobacillus kefiri]|uniref:AraC family transcriptional regulator n=1 Tax=Lentilactobacillus kefiri TaxID=33962 RepID=UPI001FB27125|nr:AraC family transcriptional regulator [Lentilactobacillus kefiri]UOD78370.1 AraC family transcriptional regulator [Lentilactobacillus kefiri]
MVKEYLSISCLPTPTYIQSGHVIFRPGERHPNRKNFQFFVMMFMKRGKLYIAEDDKKYTVSAGEMFILQPQHHHYSWKPMDETTEYYWIHFTTTGSYVQAAEPKQVRPVISVPAIHYYTSTITLFLRKQQTIPNEDTVISMMNKIFANSRKSNENHSDTTQNSIEFWKAQQLFLDLLQLVQVQTPQESPMVMVANKIQRYIEDHFDEKITYEELGKEFHIHPNSVSSYMKKTFGITPNNLLTKYRLEEATKYLLLTSDQISTIATKVGYQNVYYFSMAFKKGYGMSPSEYRKKYISLKPNTPDDGSGNQFM